MGDAMAPQLAIIYMDQLERKIYKKFEDDLKWRRYIDDVFCCWSTNLSTDSILSFINIIYPNIQFTVEVPDIDGQLSFLDCEIRYDGQVFQSRLFHKPVNSNVILHWNSNCAVSTKRGVLLGELRRAHYRSTTDSDRQYSCQLIRKKFLNNGYPRRFVDNTIRIFQQRRIDSRPDYSSRNYIKCPYVNEATKRRYITFFNRLGISETYLPWFHGGLSLKRIFHPPKEKVKCSTNCKFCEISEKTNLCHTKNVIYQITCDICDQVYIGQSQRMIKSRINEHIFLRSTESAVKSHFSTSHPSRVISVKW